jgi:hypothetical protein
LHITEGPFYYAFKRLISIPKQVEGRNLLEDSGLVATAAAATTTMVP